MKFELKDYQDAAAAKVLAGLRRGSRDWADPSDREHAAVSLSAATGAGKTVIAAAVIERMWFGDPDTDAAPNPRATFLWLTDDPNLNAQTRKKILEASDRIQPGQLVTIDDGFDQPAFDPGKVYFLNTQKLGRATNFVKRREGVRKHPLWETVSGTVSDHGDQFYLVVDEAHRGTGTRSKEQTTNAARLIHGAAGLVPAAPVVWGISATPERFITSVKTANPARTLREVEVEVADVRESGLLKDTISIQFRGEAQTMTSTLVAAAVEDIVKMSAAWRTYTDAEGEPDVRPIIVVQIPDEKTMDTDEVGAVIDICREDWPELAGDGAVRHSLGDHNTVKMGSHAVPYIAPQDIQDNQRVRMVIAKEALTTGWDCPRAETMVSLRTARDLTYIAQLVGRMVRQPLARRVEADDRLNRVQLFLPHFDEKAVKQVVAHLAGDPDSPAAASDVEINTVDVGRNPTLPASVFAAFEALPSYLVPGLLHRSQVARLNKLAALLARDALVIEAISNAKAYLIGVLEGERARLDADGKLASLVADVETATVGMLETQVHSGVAATTGEQTIAISGRDLDVAMAAAGRAFRDGLADDYWAHLVGKGADPFDAKVLVVALSWDQTTRDKVEQDAEARVRQWLTTHGAAIGTRSEDRRARYQQVRAASRKPEKVGLALKNSRTMPREGTTYPKHFYSDAAGNFVPNAKGWEAVVLDTELGRPDTVAWYRNPVGGAAALRVPYPSGAPSGFSPMYPDFVFFTEHDDGTVRASIVDPHGHHLADAGPKLRGLAAYAKTEAKAFDRILSVIKAANGQFYQLDLADPAVAEALADANSQGEVEAVYLNHGSLYA